MSEKVTYRQQVSFCGKPRCRKCREGIGHGPYWFAYHLTPEGRTVRTYIGKHLPPGISAPPVSSNAPDDPPESSPITINNTPETQQGEIDALSRLLAKNPADETTAQRLMIALAKAKRRGEALRVYQRFAALLHSQPGRTPSSEMRELYETIQRGDGPDAHKGHPYTWASPPPHPDVDDMGGMGASGDVGMPLVGIRDAGTLDASFQGLGIREGQSPLVGRNAEREKLRQLLLATEQGAMLATQARPMSPGMPVVQTLQRPQPQCMVLMGESGIGKTRLAEETAREALSNGWVVLWCHAYAQERGIPYRLWSELLRNLIAQGLWDLAEAGTGAGIKQAYTPLVALLPELREAWEDVEEPDGEQIRLREAVYELMVTISERTPLLLVLDDVQWADGSSCEMFGYVGRRLSSRRIALLGTCRETELAGNTTLQSLLGHMQREQVIEYLHVQPLADTEIAALVAHLPDPLVRRIQAQAAGNPFFAEELALSMHGGEYKQAVIGAGARIDRAGTAGSETANGEALPALPKSITAALNARMRRLSAACQQLLERAAVLGGSFSLPLIYAMESVTAGQATQTAQSLQVDEDAVLDLLDEAIRSGILTEEGTGARISYRFWHPLLATYLYATLSATRRARLHRRAADAMQSVYTAREHGLNEQAAAITDHLVKGGADAEQIAHFAELAANHAYVLSAYPEAERHYRLAAHYLEATGTQVMQTDAFHLAFLLERLAECVLIQGDFKEARSLFERVLEVHAGERAVQSASSSAQEAQIQALLWSEIGRTWHYTGERERAWQCFERGEQVLREADIPAGPTHARLLYQRGSLLLQEGRYEEARRAALQALDVFETTQTAQRVEGPQAFPAAQQPGEDTARLTRIRRTLLGDPVDLGRTHVLLGSIDNSTGYHAGALDHLHKALALYERYERQREIAHVCNNIGHVFMKQGRYQQARQYLQRAYTLAERIGDTPLIGVVLHNLGELANSPDKRDLEEAEHYFRRSLLMAEQIDDREYLSRWNADLALVLIESRDLAGSAQHAARALSIARAMHNIPCAGYALVTLGALRITQASTTDNGESGATSNAHSPRSRRAYLQRARRTLEHALTLQGLEVETSTRARITLAEALLLLGEHEEARAQATRAMEEARRYELGELVKLCERVLDIHRF